MIKFIFFVFLLLLSSFDLYILCYYSILVSYHFNFLDFFLKHINLLNLFMIFLHPPKNKCRIMALWDEGALLQWLRSFESNNFILKQLYNMKSPSRQVVNRDIKTSMNLLLRQDNPEKSNSNPSNLRRVICENG